MSPITTYAQLEDFGRIRLSKRFFMRDFLHSEIAAWHGLRNVPLDPDRAVRNGRRLCEELLEPLQATFGRIHIRSGYRSPEVNDLGNRNKLNCASNQNNYARHIWDHPDANGKWGAMACVVVPALVDYMEKGGSWTAMAWWIHDHLPYGSLHFFTKLGAFNIGWHEAPERRIDSYVPPKGCLTRPGMANHAGSHADQYPGFPTLVRPATAAAGVASAANARPTARPTAPERSSFAAEAAPTGTPASRSHRSSVGSRVANAKVNSPAPEKPAAAPRPDTQAAPARTFASAGGAVRYRAVHTRTRWRKVNSHRSLDAAISGKDGAAALFRRKVRISYETHGDPRYVLVWQQGASHGYAIKPDAREPDGIRVASVPLADLQKFEGRGGASDAELERYF